MSNKDLPTCQACRARHAKCDNEAIVCRRCQTNDIQCIRKTVLRFRYGLDSEKIPKFTFPESQVWLPTSRDSQFYDEGAMLIQHYENLSFEQLALPGTLIAHNAKPYDIDGCQTVLGDDLEESAATRSYRLEHSIEGLDQDLGDLSATQSAANPTVTLERSCSTPGSNSISHSRSLYSLTTSPAVYLSNVEPFSDREAELMRNFIENMALWLDVSDIERHFELEVPRRAQTNLTLRNAVFAFSSRHVNRHQKQKDLSESLDYHNRTLQMLIPQISGPEERLTDEVFAAVVILRLDEEMEEEDNHFHLTGATRILNSVSDFVSSGGLGEAAAWVCLRQDIYISIVSKKALKTRLEKFHTSSWIKKENDIGWANRMVLLLASVLTHAFSEPSSTKRIALQNLHCEIREWNENKPVGFELIKSSPRGKTRDKRLPVLWMLSPFHVLGVQYYHIARIVLLFALPPSNSNLTGSMEQLQQSRRTERMIREHLLTIIGLAVSNPRAENTLFTAMHALTAWGGVLHHRLDQEAAVDFLLLMEKRSGWQIARTLDTLQTTWQEDRESD